MLFGAESHKWQKRSYEVVRSDNGKALASLGTTSRENLAATGSGLACAKPDLAGAFFTMWSEGRLHRNELLKRKEVRIGRDAVKGCLRFFLRKPLRRMKERGKIKKKGLETCRSLHNMQSGEGEDSPGSRVTTNAAILLK